LRINEDIHPLSLSSPARLRFARCLFWIRLDSTGLSWCRKSNFQAGWNF